MGLITKVSFAEQIAAINGALNNIKQEWNKTIYVDQQSGDDNNPGTQDAPVQTLQRAIDMVPVGGHGNINLIADYVLETDVYIENKYIDLQLGGIKLSSNWYIDGDWAKIRQIKVRNSAIYIQIFQENPGGTLPQVFIPQNNTGKNIYISKMSLIQVIEKGISSVNFYLNSHVEGNPIEVRDGALVGGDDWSRRGTFVSIGILGVNYHNVLVGTSAYLIRCGHSVWGFSSQSDINFIDENGQTVNIAEKIFGIIRDVNGVPRNIISNVIL